MINDETVEAVSSKSTSTVALNTSTSTMQSSEGCRHGAILLLWPSWSLQEQQPTFTQPQCVATGRRKPKQKKHLRTNSQMDGPVLFPPFCSERST